MREEVRKENQRLRMSINGETRKKRADPWLTRGAEREIV
jgi:hypothetical protein